MSAKTILVHTCCAPCLIAPYQRLKEEWDVTLLWYNPNIHPYTEYIKRRDAVRDFAARENIPIIWQDEYNLELYLNATGHKTELRCESCYNLRLERTAQIAMGREFDAFTTTLLYSRTQKHEIIKSVCENLASQFGVDFFYQDWRPLWQEGIDLSKAAGMYRQSYCGCIFSEQDRYQNKDNVMI